MNPSTAVGLIMVALALLQSRGSKRRLAFAVSGGTIGALKLLDLVFGLDIGVDRLLFQDRHPLPSPMALTTAANLVLIATASVLLDHYNRRWICAGQLLASLASLLSLFALGGYLYDVQAMYDTMAIHTAIAFILLACAVLLSRPDEGLATFLTSDTAGSALVRRLGPAVILLPLVLGYLRLLGQQAGAYDATVGIVLFAMATIVLLSVLLFVTGRRLHRAELDHRVLERERMEILEHTPNLLGVAGLDGYLKVVNPAWRATLGTAESRLLAEPFPTFFHPDDRKKLINMLSRLTKKRNFRNIELRLLCADGSVRHLAWNLTSLHRENRILLTGLDITDRKRFEDELRAKHDLLESVLETVSDGMTLSDEQGYFHVFNAKMEEITGYTKAEALASGDFSRLVYPRPEDHQCALDGLKEIIEQRGARDIETTIVAKDGSEKELLVSTSILEQDGRMLFLSAYHDISLRKRMETALEVQKAYFERLFEEAPEAIALVGEAGVVVRVNAEFVRMFDYSREEVQGREITELITPDDLREQTRVLRQRIERGETLSFESTRLRKDGTPFDVSVTAAPVPLEGGGLGIYVMYRDISERRRIEAERELLITQLQQALADVKTLSGLLPICAWCKKIRDDGGYYHAIESYISKHSAITFTHGICPDCKEKWKNGFATAAPGSHEAKAVLDEEVADSCHCD